MIETLNKRIIPILECERRENARRYWAAKLAKQNAAATTPSTKGEKR